MSAPVDAAIPAVSVAVRGSSSRFLQAVGLFATGVATTAVLMAAAAKETPEIGAVLGTMQAQRGAANARGEERDPRAAPGGTILPRAR